MAEETYTIYSCGYPEDYADKDKRSMTWSPYQYVPFYIKKGEVIKLFVSGKTKEKVFVAIGLPVDESDVYTSQLVDGDNAILATRDGLLSFTNFSEKNNVFIKITSSHQRVPYFELYKSSNKGWTDEMEKYSNAPYVILSSDFSDIIVTYNSAKEYIKDAYSLMINNELIIKIENSVSGLVVNGRFDYKLDRNRALHLEAYNHFMYATNGYTGYNRANGAMPQLLGLSNDRFGVWHENGHQRQQYPWKWTKGSGMGEVTVNIYSLSVQEQLMGRASRFDEFYSDIKKFLAQSVKSYDDADLFVKLGLFWQLRLAFGEGFYPQLHQIYRMMDDMPPTNDHHGQKQLLILTTSHLVNINLGPFFAMWGIYSDLETLTHLSFLPELTKPIWENNNDNYHRLPMPVPKYIPELIYFKNSIKDVVITSDHISFTIDQDWYLYYRYVFMVNGKYIGELNDGVAYYVRATLTSAGYKIDWSLNPAEHAPLTERDIFSVEVYHQGEHVIYHSSILLDNLWEDVRRLYSDDNFTSLSDGTNQKTLDDLLQRYEQAENEHTVFIKNKILLAQQLLLRRTIKNDKRNETFYSVEFTDTSYKNYTYLARSSDQLLGQLKNGQPVLSDTISGTTWIISADRYKYDEIDIIAIVNGDEYLIRRVFWEEFVLRDKIEELLSGGDDKFDEDNFSQKDIDNVRADILNSDLPYWKQMLLLDELAEVQILYLATTLKDVYISEQYAKVIFNENALFHNYRYMLMSDSGYISEVSYGKAYYSSLSNYIWTTSVTQKQLDSLHIIAYVNDTWYTIYTFSNGTRHIIFDYP